MLTLEENVVRRGDGHKSRMDPAKALTFREELPEEEVSTERLATRIQSDKRDVRVRCQ